MNTSGEICLVCGQWRPMCQHSNWDQEKWLIPRLAGHVPELCSIVWIQTVPRNKRDAAERKDVKP